MFETADGTFFGICQHFSLLNSTSATAAIQLQLGGMFGLATSLPLFLQAWQDPHVIGACEAAVKGISSVLLEFVRDAVHASEFKALCTQQVGNIKGPIAFANATFVASRMHISLCGMNEDAVEGGSENAAFLVSKTIHELVRGASENTVKFGDHRGSQRELVQALINFVRNSEQAHDGARTVLRAFYAAPGDDELLPGSADIRVVLRAFAVHNEASFAGVCVCVRVCVFKCFHHY